MPQVSKVRLDKRLEEQLIKNLEIVLGRLSKTEMNSFLISFLTKTERLMLAKRLAIVILLKEGLSDTQISQTLKVTRVTVSRMQLFLEARGQGYSLALQKLNEEKALDEFKDFIVKLAKYSIRAAGGRVKPGIL